MPGGELRALIKLGRSFTHRWRNVQYWMAIYHKFIHVRFVSRKRIPSIGSDLDLSLMVFVRKVKASVLFLKSHLPLQEGSRGAKIIWTSHLSPFHSL